MKIKFFAFLILLALFGCDSTETATVAEETSSTEGQAFSAVYVLSNSAGTNSVLTYARDASGNLTLFAETPTGGSGTGGDLGGGLGGLTYDATTGLLYAVNAGSNSLTCFQLNTDGTLSLLDTVNTGGTLPVSVAVYLDTVYVLNAGDSTIQGFRLVNGSFVAIDSVGGALSTATAGAIQLRFFPTATILVASERDNNNLTTLLLDGNRAASPASIQSSVGTAPTGFDFTPAGILVCGETAGALSSYSVAPDGSLISTSGSVASGENGTAAVTVLENGLFAFASNTGSGSISSYVIGGNGSLSFLARTASETGPVDLAVSADEAFLFCLSRAVGRISIYQLNRDSGSLTVLAPFTALPANCAGIVAR